MKTRTILAFALLTLLSGSTIAEIKTHTAWITFPDRTQMSCWSIEGPYGSTTHCRSFSAPSRGTADAPRFEISIEPEIEAAWGVAYKYIKKAKTRRGWKNRVKGPLGDLVISSTAVSLGDKTLPRSGSEIEAAVWQLTRQALGITPEDVESGTTFVSR